MKPNLGGLKGVAACLLVLAACNPAEKAAGEPASAPPPPMALSEAPVPTKGDADVVAPTDAASAPETVETPPVAAPTASPSRPAVPDAPAEQAAASPPAATRVVTQLPDGPGRDVVQRVCTGCHAADAFTTQGHDAAGWQTIIGQMQNLGMSASDEDLAVVRAYLARELPPR